MKLCECGCGEPTKIADCTRKGCGDVKGQPRRFIRGHHNRVQTAETRAKMSAARRGRVPHGWVGEAHPNWKGDAANYGAIHTWLRRHFPKQGVCEECGAEGPTEYAFQRHPESYTRNRDDYLELCVPCHRRMDYDARQAA